MNDSALKMLRVKDAPVLRETGRKLLCAAGYQVAAAETSAVAAVRKKAFDLALPDVKLSDGRGVDVWRHVREIYSPAEAVVMTACEEEESITNAFALGAHSWLRNPFEVQTLGNSCSQAKRRHDE